MKKGSTADFMSGEQFEAFSRRMLAANAIRDIYDLAEQLGVTVRTINRMRDTGGDKMLALACQALVNGLTPFDEVEVPDTAPVLPKYGARGRPDGSKDRSPRKRTVETEDEMRARIEAEVRAKFGLPPEAVAEADEEVAA